MASKKDMFALVRHAQRSGLHAVRLRNGHWKIVSLDGTWTVIPFSPGSGSSVRLSRRAIQKMIDSNNRKEG